MVVICHESNLAVVINLWQETDEGESHVLQRVVDVVLNLLNSTEVNSRRPLFSNSDA